MSGDLQAKRKSKNRSKKKSQLHELERLERLEESQLNFSADGEKKIGTKTKVSILISTILLPHATCLY